MARVWRSEDNLKILFFHHLDHEAQIQLIRLDNWVLLQSDLTNPLILKVINLDSRKVKNEELTDKHDYNYKQKIPLELCILSSH